MSDATVPAHRERLHPGPAVLAAAVGLGLVLGLVAAPFGTPAAVAVGAVVAAAGVAALLAASPVVEVRDGELRAGRAHVPARLLGDVVPLTAERMREELGPVLDARAYVCLRTWARTGVRVELDDPADPTPYWLVSTRHPELLAQAVAAARDAAAA
ncbi:DUF3093 domain-containing protein [Puerhibacterium puerhi]|uniref:DUF3093 domain-containing protein n=1 Tax=Puerhibacterium puerhi TaxID=2692623 RepID=UPI0013594B2E|nr:DUF3093 domain-containing protein [Puerhibacterium puerhi]